MRIKECQDTFFIGLSLPKLVTFLIVNVFKYNQQLRTMGEHFGGNLNSYMLMTTEFGVFFVNMNFNFVMLLLQRNPAIAHFKGPVDFMPYCERCLIANI